MLSSLGICLYGALDYGLDDNEERQLTRELELLLLKLTSSLNDVDGEGDEGNDEGIQTDIELTFNCVLQVSHIVTNIYFTIYYPPAFYVANIFNSFVYFCGNLTFTYIKLSEI